MMKLVDIRGIGDSKDAADWEKSNLCAAAKKEFSPARSAAVGHILLVVQKGERTSEIRVFFRILNHDWFSRVISCSK